MFKKFAIPLALIIAAGTLQLFPAKAATANEDYLIRNISTGRYLTAANDELSSGVPVIEYSADGISSGNLWIKTTDENHITHFVSEQFPDSFALGVNQEGKLTVVNRNDNDLYQQFILEETDSGTKITASGFTLSPELSETDGARLSMQEENVNSFWELIPVHQNSGIKGDIQQDELVNIYDLLLAKQILLQSRSMSIEQRYLADVDGISGFSLTDIITLNQYLLGKGNLSSGDFPENTIPPVSDLPKEEPTEQNPTETEPEEITLDDMPENYREPLEWIWENRFAREGSTTRWNTIFDQICAGNGTLNFGVRWQSYKTITYEQRQQFQKLASDCINAWNDYLRNYDGWQYDHIDVNITGWAVLDKSCLLDLHENEIVYDNLISDYDSQYDTSNGIETIPDKLPSAPAELSRFDHFAEPNYTYPGGLDKRFDMYLWCTQGFPAVGGAGGDWGQRLSDDAYLNMLDGQNIHVLEHEIGHGFGITDFYGGEGEIDGFPPGGFPDGGTSIMMAGSSMEITDFDGWMLRYIWSKIKDEDGRFPN